MAEGETLLLDKITPEQKFTQPPARYTEASLIKAMEEKGIGRPSTYAPTISTILDRKYVEKDKKYLLPTELGKAVTELLEKNFESIVDVEFTADMEKELDTVESGENNWVEILDRFYPPFHDKIVKATDGIERVKIADVPTGEKCPDCQEGDLVDQGKAVTANSLPVPIIRPASTPRTSNRKSRLIAPMCGSGLVQRCLEEIQRQPFLHL